MSRIFPGPPAPVNLFSHRNALKFEDRLIRGAKTGPNFAGHHTLLSWPCGPGCRQLVIIDAKTGMVAWAPFLARQGFDYRIDSNLLIVNPPGEIEKTRKQQGARGPYRTLYYLWDFNNFRQIHETRHE